MNFDAHTLHDEDSYAGHGDPNDALQAGELTLDYLERIQAESGRGGRSKNNPMQPADSGRSENNLMTGGANAVTAADLIPYWNGSDVGHLGRWLWERGGVPEGEVSPGLYADRELHVWIKEKLEAGPQGTTEQDRIRLRWVLWKLYAAYGPEEVPDWQIPIPPMRRA